MTTQDRGLRRGTESSSRGWVFSGSGSAPRGALAETLSGPWGPAITGTWTREPVPQPGSPTHRGAPTPRPKGCPMSPAWAFSGGIEQWVGLVQSPARGPSHPLLLRPTSAPENTSAGSWGAPGPPHRTRRGERWCPRAALPRRPLSGCEEGGGCGRAPRPAQDWPSEGPERRGWRQPPGAPDEPAGSGLRHRPSQCHYQELKGAEAKGMPAGRPRGAHW